ncbi:MAG: orotidine 5'-phosphate decarboxylase [Deltaproteobacteria bacterium]|nr:orotidine 5'-phosphate decarboxylase [Deltaproteobacteria bacterium]
MTRMIVALDGVTFHQARETGILATLSEACAKNLIWGVKISDMLYSGDAIRIISALKEEFKLGVMADVKLHDIPSTMENSIGKLAGAGANIVTIHCSSNYRPKNSDLLKYIAGVTALTSFTDLEIKWIYDKSYEEIVQAFSDIALMNNYGYILGSVKDMTYIQDNPLKKICTGIRPSWYRERHDQVRIASVKEALRTEADFIVIGRPITTAENTLEAIERICAELQ